MAVRIQRSRAKGSRLSPGTVCVTRPGKWSNPYRIQQTRNGQWWVFRDGDNWGPYADKVEAAHSAVALFRFSVRGDHLAIQADLRGADLACWCKPGDPCHADVLLEIANA
jgi:hypothetical protein